MAKRTIGALLAVTCNIAACQPAESPGAAPTVTVTAAQPQPAASGSPAAEPTGSEPTKPSSSQKKRIPNVVGMNHQKAQNHLQSVGFYFLTEEDATGRGRLLVWDRNWVVVRQSPKPGTMVSVDTKVLLSSKKITD